MKKISVVVPCYNEEKSVHKIHKIITDLFKNELKNYDYELIFNDDYSTDNTRNELEKICASDPKVKAILNAKNFGYIRNVFYSLTQATGDAVFMFFGDMQDPPELLPKFVKEWENGYKVVIGQKKDSDESKILFFLRTVFYGVMGKYSQVNQIQHFSGYGLYDRLFIDTIKQIEDPMPYFKGIVGEFASDLKIIQYHQRESERGHSNVNFAKAYDVAMLGITSYTKAFMRVATFIGILLGLLSTLFASFVFVSKLLEWDIYPYGLSALLIGVFFIGGIQLFFLGILGEYILTINSRIVKKPLVIPGKKINFDKD